MRNKKPPKGGVESVTTTHVTIPSYPRDSATLFSNRAIIGPAVATDVMHLGGDGRGVLVGGGVLVAGGGGGVFVAHVVLFLRSSVLR